MALDPDKINVYYTNSRSIRNKIDLLRGIACAENLDIIAITETWLDMAEKDFLSEFEINGYNVYHKDRKGRKGGGVAIHLKKKNTIQSHFNNTVKSGESSEKIWVEYVS